MDVLPVLDEGRRYNGVDVLRTLNYFIVDTLLNGEPVRNLK